MERLDKLSTREQFSFEIKLGKAVVLALQGKKSESEKLFAELENQENTSDYILPYWKIAIEPHRTKSTGCMMINLRTELTKAFGTNKA